MPGYESAPENEASDPGFGARYPLALVTAKAALHFLNSSYANLPRPLRAEREPRLDLHPADAAPRGIADGDEVRVFNRPGGGATAGAGRDRSAQAWWRCRRGGGRRSAPGA